MATHFSILSWRIPWTRSLVGAVHSVAKSWANVLVSDVQHNDPGVLINTYLFSFRFFSLIGYYKILSIIPVLYSRSLLVIYFIYSNVCMLK